MQTRKRRLFVTARLLVVFTAVLSASAAQLTERVNCGGSRSTLSVTMPPPSTSFPPVLGCGDYNQVFLGEAWAREFAFTVAAIIPNPDVDPRFLRGGVSASLDFEGRYLITPSLPEQAFWSACVTNRLTNSGGSGFVTGFYGPYGIDAPCDFAHATPLLPQTIVDVEFDLGVQSGFVIETAIRLQFFDAAGNPAPSSFRLELIPGEVPEPSTALLMLLPGLAWALSRPRPRRSL